MRVFAIVREMYCDVGIRIVLEPYCNIYNFPKRATISFRRFGGALVSLDWPALTPALTEIRLFVLAECPPASGHGITLNRNSWLFSSRRQAHFLLADQGVFFLMPNVF